MARLDDEQIGARLDRLGPPHAGPTPPAFLGAVRRRRAARRWRAASLAVLVAAAGLTAGWLARTPRAPQGPIVLAPTDSTTPGERLLAPVTLRELSRVNRDAGPDELMLPLLRSGRPGRVLRVVDTLNAEEVADGL